MAAQAPFLPAPFRPGLEPGAGLVRVCVLASGRARPNAGEALVRITCARHDDPERTGRAGVELCPVIRSDAAEAYFVLGGLCVFEAQVDWFSREIDKLAAPYNAAAPEDIEFHASEVFSRRAAPWDKLSSDEARGTLKSVLQVVNNGYNTTCLLACAIDKKAYPGLDPVEMAFEDLCRRFDLFLSRLKSVGDTQRGMDHPRQDYTRDVAAEAQPRVP